MGGAPARVSDQVRALEALSGPVDFGWDGGFSGFGDAGDAERSVYLDRVPPAGHRRHRRICQCPDSVRQRHFEGIEAVKG